MFFLGMGNHPKAAIGWGRIAPIEAIETNDDLNLISAEASFFISNLFGDSPLKSRDLNLPP